MNNVFESCHSYRNRVPSTWLMLSLLRGAPLWREATRAQPRVPAALALAAASPSALIARTMKVMSSLKKRCEHCKFVKRGTIAYVYCKANPRHKARQGPKRRQKR